MASPPVALPNISSIGTPANPVEVIYVKIIQKCENISHELSTMGAGTETFAGQTFDTGTNAITMIENTIMSGTFQTTGIFTPAGHINLANQTYFISGDGLVNKGMTVTTAGKVVCKQGIQVVGTATVSTTLTVTGEVIHNDILRQNANVDIDTNWTSGTGGNVGMQFTGANANFSANVTVHGDCQVSSATGDYYHGANKGKTGTITLAAITQINVSGGVIFNWS